MIGQTTRSHAVLTVHLAMSGDDEGRTVEEQNAGRGVATGPGRRVGGGGGGGRGGGVATTSKLNLVDLAGSEKSATGATGADAALHREGRFINKSLAFLEQVGASGAVELRPCLELHALFNTISGTYSQSCRRRDSSTAIDPFTAFVPSRR